MTVRIRFLYTRYGFWNKKEKNMLNPNIRLIGKQVYLRPITTSEEDTNNIVKWRNSEVVKPYFIYQEQFTPEGHAQWLKNVIIPGKGHQFIVCRKEDDKPIGSIFFRDIDHKNRKSEYGMFLGEEMEKGKGIGCEMATLLSNFGFEQLNFHKVTARILADNRASLYSNFKAGFVQEALLRDDVIINGEFRDVVLVARYHPKETPENK